MKVQLNPKGYELNGTHRIGYVAATEHMFEAVFGEAHGGGQSEDNKVTKVWYFETPHGRASVRNWHTNPADRLTLASTNRDAAADLAEHISDCGLVAALEA